ncbi:unnamed protein product [Clonostachys solani]|uniref:Uncharacterized protein n=1 Tax=Clonostachys solani TaxID=160281 RepID=A0A9N9Z0L6_9HYPO|nr:unnamed protein product [Clonostachys solani]
MPAAKVPVLVRPQFLDGMPDVSLAPYAIPNHGRLAGAASDATHLAGPKLPSGLVPIRQPLPASASLLSSIAGSYQGQANQVGSEEHDGQTPPTLDSPGVDGNNQRLVGPIVDSDSQVLSEILSCRLGSRRIVRTVWTHGANGPSKAAVFTESRRRPVGLTSGSNLSWSNLDIIQKFLEPHLSRLVDMCEPVTSFYLRPVADALLVVS